MNNGKFFLSTLSEIYWPLKSFRKSFLLSWHRPISLLAGYRAVSKKPHLMPLLKVMRDARQSLKRLKFSFIPKAAAFTKTFLIKVGKPRWFSWEKRDYGNFSKIFPIHLYSSQTTLEHLCCHTIRALLSAAYVFITEQAWHWRMPLSLENLCIEYEKKFLLYHNINYVTTTHSNKVYPWELPCSLPHSFILSFICVLKTNL